MPVPVPEPEPPPQLVINPTNKSTEAAAVARGHSRRRPLPAIRKKPSNPNGMSTATMKVRFADSAPTLEATLIVSVRVWGVVDPPLKVNDPLGGLNVQLM